jgi:hypothetical protein
MRWIAILAPLLATQALASETPNFTNIDRSDFDKIVRELSGNFAYSSVTPASSLGSVWGVELGVTGGITDIPDILAIVKRASPNTAMKDYFPHAAALGRVTVPLGITAEAMILPKLTAADVSLKHIGGALMWTITDVFFEDLPVHWAVKGSYSTTSVNFSQNVTPIAGGAQVPATIDFDDKMMGIHTMISKKFLFFEPYVSVGLIKAEGTLSVLANVPATVFSNSFTTGDKATTEPSSAQFLGGLDVRLAFFSLGAEYQRSFGTSSYTGRLSFRF